MRKKSNNLFFILKKRGENIMGRGKNIVLVIYNRGSTAIFCSKLSIESKCLRANLRLGLSLHAVKGSPIYPGIQVQDAI